MKYFIMLSLLLLSGCVTTKTQITNSDSVEKVEPKKEEIILKSEEKEQPVALPDIDPVTGRTNKFVVDENKPMAAPRSSIVSEDLGGSTNTTNLSMKLMSPSQSVSRLKAPEAKIKTQKKIIIVSEKKKVEQIPTSKKKL